MGDFTLDSRLSFQDGSYQQSLADELAKKLSQAKTAARNSQLTEGSEKEEMVAAAHQLLLQAEHLAVRFGVSTSDAYVKSVFEDMGFGSNFASFVPAYREQAQAQSSETIQLLDFVIEGKAFEGSPPMIVGGPGATPMAIRGILATRALTTMKSAEAAAVSAKAVQVSGGVSQTVGLPVLPSLGLKSVWDWGVSTFFAGDQEPTYSEWGPAVSSEILIEYGFEKIQPVRKDVVSIRYEDGLFISDPEYVEPEFIPFPGYDEGVRIPANYPPKQGEIVGEDVSKNYEDTTSLPEMIRNTEDPFDQPGPGDKLRRQADEDLIWEDKVRRQDRERRRQLEEKDRKTNMTPVSDIGKNYEDTTGVPKMGGWTETVPSGGKTPSQDQEKPDGKKFPAEEAPKEKPVDGQGSKKPTKPRYTGLQEGSNK